MTALHLGPLTIGVTAAPIVAAGEVSVTLETQTLADGTVRVVPALSAATDSRLHGVRIEFTVHGLGSRLIVLSHPNLDQEASGLPSRLLSESDVIRRGFDQVTWDGTVAFGIVGERPERWVPFVETRRAGEGLTIAVEQTDPPRAGVTTPIMLAAGERLVADPVLLGTWDDPVTASRTLADAVAAATPALACVGPSPNGWNSWDHYGWMINERIVFAEAGALPPGFDLISLSGPWFDRFGDWRPHPDRFPSGLATVIARLRERGIRTQLWIAPFLVESDSALALEHPEWLLRDGTGEPVTTGMAPPTGGAWQYAERSTFVLDATHPGARDWLTQLARGITVDLGASALFVDFLRAASLPGERYQPSLTGVQAFRAGMAAMRAGLRDGSQLMGASGTIGLYPGEVHAGRIGPDITLPPLGHPVIVRWTGPDTDPEDGFRAESFPPAAGRVVATWAGVGGSAKEVSAFASRWTMHRRGLRANPDAVLLLGSEAEARSNATLWSMTGGMFLLGDSLVSLPDDRLAIATDPVLGAIRALDRAAVPVDLFERPGEVPSVWRLDATPWGDIVAVTCWDDYGVRRSVRTGRRRAHDLRTGAIWELSGDVVLDIAAHDTALVRLFDEEEGP